VMTILISGFIADTMITRRMHPTVVRLVFQLIGIIVPTSFLIILALVYFSPTAVTTLTIVAGSLIGVQVSGFATDVLDVSPAFAGIIMGVTLLFASIPQVGSAFLFPYLVAKFHSWTAPLLVASGIAVIAGLIWVMFATGRRTDTAQMSGSVLKL